MTTLDFARWLHFPFPRPSGPGPGSNLPLLLLVATAGAPFCFLSLSLPLSLCLSPPPPQHLLFPTPLLLKPHTIPARLLILDHLEIVRTQAKRLQDAIPQLLQLAHHLAHFLFLGSADLAW